MRLASLLLLTLPPAAQAFRAAPTPASALASDFRGPLPASLQRAASNEAAGLIPPSAQHRSMPGAQMSAPGADHMGVGELLREYGLVAILFHFSVWITSLAAVYAGVSLAGPEVLSGLPDWIPGEAQSGGQLAVALGVVEVVGPARLALTVAATPAISRQARRIPLARLALLKAERVGRRVLER